MWFRYACSLLPNFEQNESDNFGLLESHNKKAAYRFGLGG